MAEALSVVASVIAVVQIAGKITDLCRFYTGTVHDAPLGLRAILRELTILRTTFEALELLVAKDGNLPQALSELDDQEGPIQGCQKAIKALEALFPLELVKYFGQSQSQGLALSRFSRKNLKTMFALSAWPFKESTAKKLLELIAQHKATIDLKLSFGVV
ncbi:hypothetical protein K505DRAFT_343532 [Melanomma pulvis-pyrius CBS 109.77]|uniref:NACHT-NTPase and P-loop NTPases N-terminal domain-containing protein n=1 Tax=Melanomma pulvis-pyrius CBS 109.77 TaxID=1314802 RepID=A0A6A6WRN4_9PLEO|nr:hypothetical protein K505DRAFT_343532 [Melanomma pulvis-pyrius CBS 109.77]